MGGDGVKNTNCTCGGVFRFSGRHTILMDTVNGVRPPFGIGSELQVDLYICDECHEMKWYALNGEDVVQGSGPSYGDMLGYSDRGLLAVIDDRNSSEETKTMARKLLSQRHPPVDRAGKPTDREEIESYCRMYRTYSTGDLQRMYADEDYPAAMHEALGKLLGERGKQAAAEKRERSQKTEKDPWDK